MTNMKDKHSRGQSRRSFINKITKGALAYSIAPAIVSGSIDKQRTEFLRRTKRYAANDNIQIGLIGAGGMGNADADTAITVPGGKIIAACDLYDGRLESARKKYGNDIFVTRDYKEI